MRAVNIRSGNGDDAYFDRLFSYFQSQFQGEISKFVPIRGNVFLIKTKKQSYILKGYSNHRKLKLQEAFTATLRKEGFKKTYRFLEPPSKEQLYFEGTHYGCLEYLSANKSAFSFHTRSNRQEGLDLIEQFHDTTKSFEKRYRTLMPNGDILAKWTERYHLFLNNLPFLRHFIKEPFVSEMVSWAYWSLTGMEQQQTFFHNEADVILHGDVAHHNFLRDKTGKLHLIDFDLINIGPPVFDYLQYANRILPFIDWSYDNLLTYTQMKKYKREPAFLYALAYPADIFREWNRIIREKSYSDETKLRQVIDLSVGQFTDRKNFVEQLKDLLE
ncbi:phosphotransferase [Neobacillus sp. GCM10023253]|uniref:phosphotransferase n=1 Tax=Neobacillus sp. GCM10023253 TaxID=3252644 RepID=UPI00361A9DC6